MGRVIARPFTGEYPEYTRTVRRHDFSLEPPGETLLDALKAAGKEVIGVGKISDIFAGLPAPIRMKETVKIWSERLNWPKSNSMAYVL